MPLRASIEGSHQYVVEIANVVAFLASGELPFRGVQAKYLIAWIDESFFMNGQVVTVDNGLTNGLSMDKVLA